MKDPHLQAGPIREIPAVRGIPIREDPHRGDPPGPVLMVRNVAVELGGLRINSLPSNPV